MGRSRTSSRTNPNEELRVFKKCLYTCLDEKFKDCTFVFRQRYLAALDREFRANPKIEQIISDYTTEYASIKLDLSIDSILFLVKRFGIKNSIKFSIRENKIKKGLNMPSMVNRYKDTRLYTSGIRKNKVIIDKNL